MGKWSHVELVTAGATNLIDCTADGASASEPPKLMIVASVFQTATGPVDGTGRSSIGFITKDGGSLQHQSLSGVNEDAQGTSFCAIENSSTRALVAIDPTSATAASRVEEYNVAAAGDWTDTGITLTRNTGSAAPLILVMVLGGSDITARAGGAAVTNAVANQSFTVAAGWGQPTYVFGMTSGSSSTGIGLTQSNPWAGCFGVAKSDTEMASMAWFAGDNAATSTIAGFNTASAFIFTDPSLSSGLSGKLAAVGNYPTDGFRVDFPSNSGATYLHYLAVKDTSGSDLSSLTFPSSATNQDRALAFNTPKLGLFFGMNCLDTGLTIASSDPSGVQLGAWGLGAVSAAGAEGFVGFSMDDNNATENTGGSTSSAKAWQVLDPAATGAPTLQGEADGALLTSTTRLAVTDADVVATRKVWTFTLGLDVAAPSTRRRRMMLGKGR